MTARIIYTKGPNGIEFRIDSGEGPVPTGAVTRGIDDLPTGVSPAQYIEGKVLEDGTLRDPTAAESLATAKKEQETRVRDAAEAEYHNRWRAFEGTVVTYKAARNLSLNVEEQAIFDGMMANYTRLRGLIVQIRGASTVEAVRGVEW